MSNIVIHQAGLRAGGGKSHALITAAIKRASEGRNTLIVVPTINLMREIVRAFETRKAPQLPKIFHHADNEPPVTQRVLKYIDTVSIDGTTIIVSHECFKSLPYFSRKKHWRVFVDEDVSVFKLTELHLHENHQFITDHIEIREAGPKFSLIGIKDRGTLIKIGENKNDDAVWNTLRPTAKLLLNDNYRHYVMGSDFGELIAGRRKKSKLSLYSLLTPRQFQGFERLTITAAGIEDSLTHHYWSSLGIEWMADDEIYTNALRPVHPLNASLKIHYGYEQANSKHLRNRLAAIGNNDLRKAAENLMDGEKYLWLENNDWLGRTTLSDGETGERLPPRSHGLNNFSSVHHAILLPAYNHSPASSGFLDEVAGFDRDMQIKEMNLHLYQAGMRTSIRLDDMTNEKKWVVASRFDAELLSARLPGSTIHSLGLTQPERPKLGRPKKHADDCDRKREYEQKRKDNRALRAAFGTDLDLSLLDSVTFLKSDDRKTLSIGNYVGNFRCSYFDNMYQVMSKSICMNESAFIAYLKDHHSHIYNRKDDIPAICGAMFNPDKTENGPRDTFNVEFVRGIWIDVEDGDLTPDAFSRAFPSLQFIAYNTYRHTKQNQRFRIYIPTKRAMHLQEAIDIYDILRYKLRQDGYVSGKKSLARSGLKRLYDGIDVRRNPAMLSLLPCQAQNKKDSFFWEFIEGRQPLNVNVWLRQRILGEGDDAFYDLPPIPSETAIELTGEQREAVNRAVGAWNLVGRTPKNGDASMFQLYRALREASVPMVTLQQVLFDAAANANSPIDRKRQANRLLRQIG